MGLFTDKNNLGPSFLGVDIGGSSIKIVELANNAGRPQLVTYGYMERSLNEDKIKLIDQPEQTAEFIKKICASSKCLSKKAITALPAQAVYSSIIFLPEVMKKDLSSTKKITAAVEWEAKKILPLPLEEMILDWKIIGSDAVIKDSLNSKEERIKNLQVLITAAAKEVVQKYIEIFKKADLDLISLETESFALARSLIGKDKAPTLLLDIGTIGTDIAIVDNTIPLLTRTVSIGGLEITRAIRDTLGINMAQAEQFKRDLEMQVEQDGDGEQLPEVIKRPLQAIINEIEYSMNFYLSQPDNQNKKFEKIVITGGSAKLYNLPKIISQSVGLRTFIGNPWARIIYPEDLTPVLDAMGARLATAIGLAMRDIE